MDETTVKAFDFAIDLAKQLITLSTAILTLTAVLPQIIEAEKAKPLKWLRRAWILHLVSIAAGVLCLMALTGTIARTPKEFLKPERIYDFNITFWAGLQVVCFGLATLFVIFYGSQLPSVNLNVLAKFRGPSPTDAKAAPSPRGDSRSQIPDGKKADDPPDTAEPANKEAEMALVTV